jgi:ABC-2 type transport system permease protein
MTIQTHPQATPDLRLAARQGLLPARGSDWLAGFGNMLAKELGELFRTRRWLWQLLIWLIIIDGFIAFMLFGLPMLASIVPEYRPNVEAVFGGLPPEVVGLTYYFLIGAMAGTIGVIILAQDEIIQEKQSGTAAWILSKPVSRPAFILTKLLSNITGALVFIVALPGLVALGEIYLAADLMMPLAPLLAGAGLFLLLLIFYISLVILLGVLFESRGPVLGIAIGVMFLGMQVTRWIPQTTFVLPFGLDAITLSVSSGAALPTMAIPKVIATTLVLSIAFILLALWRFQRNEF